MESTNHIVIYEGSAKTVYDNAEQGIKLILQPAVTESEASQK
ncbi:MAG: hypothetical protein R3C11_13080 [Planctomycetaceae bacterium]